MLVCKLRCVWWLAQIYFCFFIVPAYEIKAKYLQGTEDAWLANTEMAGEFSKASSEHIKMPQNLKTINTKDINIGTLFN